MTKNHHVLRSKVNVVYSIQSYSVALRLRRYACICTCRRKLRLVRFHQVCLEVASLATIFNVLATRSSDMFVLIAVVGCIGYARIQRTIVGICTPGAVGVVPRVFLQASNGPSPASTSPSRLILDIFLLTSAV